MRTSSFNPTPHRRTRAAGWAAAFLMGALLAAPGEGTAQTDEQETVDMVVRLFDGMRERDRAKLESVFHETARLMRAGERDGQPMVSVTPIDQFIERVASAQGPIWDERIYNPVVQVDGNLAAVWVEYDFYLGDEFSHCGVDALHMARTESGWKIIQITDTQQREGCPDR
jgi:hypothetical protein